MTDTNAELREQLAARAKRTDREEWIAFGLAALVIPALVVFVTFI